MTKFSGQTYGLFEITCLLINPKVMTGKGG